MGHIHKEPGQIDATASAYIIRSEQPEPMLMLHMHKKLGKLLQFGGHIELDETPWQAVAHEIEEESGYELDQLHLLQPKIRLKNLPGSILHPQPAVLDTHEFPEIEHRHTDHAYVFITDEEPNNDVAHDESEDIRLFNRAELEALNDEEIPPSVRAIGLYALQTIYENWEKVSSSSYER